MSPRPKWLNSIRHIIRADPSAVAARLRAAQAGSPARTQAVVCGVERAKAEVIAVGIDTEVRSVTGDADERLAARIASLRTGLAEVQRLASGQGLT